MPYPRFPLAFGWQEALHGQRGHGFAASQNEKGEAF
jgi:hypothetical protein